VIQQFHGGLEKNKLNARKSKIKLKLKQNYFFLFILMFFFVDIFNPHFYYLFPINKNVVVL
jgi:hypothetical protein